MGNRIIIRCDVCKKGLFDDERALCLDEDELPGQYVCEECLERMPIEKVLGMVGRSLRSVKSHREFEEEYVL